MDTLLLKSQFFPPISLIPKSSSSFTHTHQVRTFINLPLKMSLTPQNPCEYLQILKIHSFSLSYIDYKTQKKKKLFSVPKFHTFAKLYFVLCDVLFPWCFKALFDLANNMGIDNYVSITFSGSSQKKVVIANKHGEKLVGILHESGTKDIVILCHGFRSTKVGFLDMWIPFGFCNLDQSWTFLIAFLTTSPELL